MLRQINKNTKLPEFFRQLLEGAPHVDALELDVAAAATTAVQSVRHGLGRAYRGAEVLYQDQPVSFFARPPSSAADSDQRLYFQLSAATATNLRVRLY